MPALVLQAASGQHIGQRSRQEDAVIAQFPQGDLPGLAVLSDGMGGHDDGDLAGRILASEMFGELYLSAARPSDGPDAAPQVFRDALARTNARLKQHIDAGCISADTGGTLLCITIEAGNLRWLSVGDSPLYLYRAGDLRRLNDLHSMAAQLDLLVRNGALDAEAAAHHPHRHCLTSAVTGSEVPRIDCPSKAFELQEGDVIVLASDGLNVLTDIMITDLIARHAPAGSAAITDGLLAAVRTRDAPHQDNTTLVVITLEMASVPEPEPDPESAAALSLAGLVNKLTDFVRAVRAPRAPRMRPADQRAGP